jgi:hypothetical protein
MDGGRQSERPLLVGAPRRHGHTFLTSLSGDGSAVLTAVFFA